MMRDVEYGWRSEYGISYIGSRDSVISWAAGQTTHVVVLVPLDEYDRLVSENDGSVHV